MVIHLENVPITADYAMNFPVQLTLRETVTCDSSYQFALRPLRPMNNRKRRRMFAFELLPLESLLSSQHL